LGYLTRKLFSFSSARQPSDSHGPDGGGIGLRSEKILFAPADPVDRKHRKLPKSKSKSTKSTKTKDSSRRTSSLRSEEKKDNTCESKGSEEINANAEKKCSPPPGTPPPAPRHDTPNVEIKEDDSICYAKWWMCGFADALRELVPKNH